LIYSHTEAPWKSLQEFLEYAKNNPGKVNFGTWGPGSTGDLVAKYMNHELKTGLTTVPYKGAAPVLQSVLSKQIEVGIGTVSAAMPYIAEGKLLPLAVAGEERTSFLPDVPALAEANADPG